MVERVMYQYQLQYILSKLKYIDYDKREKDFVILILHLFKQ